MNKQIDAALAQPADEDAWLAEAERLEESAIHAAYEEADVERRFDGFVTRITPDERKTAYERTRHFRDKLRAHLRARPAREGFVSVPVGALEAIRKNDERYRWLRSRIPGSAYRIAGVIYSEGGAGVDSAIDAAMIEAAKGGGK